MMRFITLLASAILWMMMPAVIHAANAADSMAISKMELVAATLAVEGDYHGAIAKYSQIIASDPTQIDAYLQRGLLYREIGQLPKSLGDAAIAERFVELRFSEGKSSAKLYYQRAMAKRLRKDYTGAKADLQTAMRMKRNHKWHNDWQALLLEEKMKP